MSILNVFKSKKTEDKITEEQESAKEATTQETKKAKHGEDGVCCGGCH
ncbi:CCGSCS motif protein [Thalassotalea psychrophila]|uniref:CCGSCS motif protein n=1 Tax=Thalassotalea psychrophila TaxID=3065647 RepID=A0ABY9TUX9_9GAMM|nr:CCGSCS motif protein [Colwelliaceae bacterium SQ149]